MKKEEVSTPDETEETQEETQESSEETKESELPEEQKETEADTTSDEQPDGKLEEETKAHYEKRINDLMSRAMKAEAQLKEEDNIKTEEPQKFADDFVPESYESLYGKFKERMSNEQAQEAATAERAKQVDRTKLNNWFDATEASDQSFNRESFLKFAGKIMDKGIRVDTSNLDGAYELYNETKKEKIIEKKIDKVAPPSAKSVPSSEVDASILKSRKSPVELAIEELRKRR